MIGRYPPGPRWSAFLTRSPASEGPLSQQPNHSGRRGSPQKYGKAPTTPLIFLRARGCDSRIFILQAILAKGITFSANLLRQDSNGTAKSANRAVRGRQERLFIC